MRLSQDILSELDARAAAYRFPGFNNEHFETVASRMVAYRSFGTWALIIEQAVYWADAGGITLLIDRFGTAVARHSSPPFDVQYETEDELRPHQIVFRDGLVVEIETGVLGEDSWSPGRAALSWVHAHHRDRLFGAPSRHFPPDPTTVFLVAVDEWQHPDVYSGVLPSRSVVFASLASAMAEGEMSRFDPGPVPNNNDWRHWASSKGQNPPTYSWM